MDEAERRFRACTDRFKRDLTRIISRSIDGMVRGALKESAKQAAHEASLAKQATRQAERDARAARKVAEKQARVEAREAKRAAAKAEKARRAAAAHDESTNGLGEQLELRLDLAAVRPQKSAGRSRVRPDSILGAELADGANASGERTTAATIPSPAAPKQPSERPLFVHKRARDGQIHALRRGLREAAAAPSADAKADAQTRERP